MSGLDAEIESIKELFKSKIKGIADKITTDATTISGIADRMRGIVTKSGNASRKITELRALIEQVDSDENLSNARQIYAGELKNLNSALDGKAPNLDHETPASNGMFSGMFSSTKSTGFMKRLKQYAMQRLIENKIKLSNDDFKALITDDANKALTRNYTNLNDTTTTDYINPNIMTSIRREIVNYMNTHKTDESKSDVQLGGFLSNSRKLRRPTRKNTRDFFKFTRKSSVIRSQNEMNKIIRRRKEKKKKRTEKKRK
jgi:hypothetical protein